MNKKIFSLLCAVSCSLIWGTAFVAQDMGMDYIGPYTFSAVRLLLGFLTLLPFFFFFEFGKVKNTIYLYFYLRFFSGWRKHFSASISFVY